MKINHLLCVVAGGMALVAAPAAEPVVGAIRWDAWVGAKSSVGRAVETSLGPQQWHHRLPFFGKVISETQVEINGYTQEIVDREIACAHQAGLDYWAFGLYDATVPSMVEARNLYLASQHKADINFCLWSGPDGLSTTQNLQRIIQLMREPTYQKVLADRPLYYVGFVDDKWVKVLGGRRRTDELRRLAQQAGLGHPYLVLMDFGAAHGKQMAEALGCDALSAYATGGGGRGAPYAALADHAEKYWDQCQATGEPVVPIVMAGSDRRPRVEHPVPWEKYQKPGVGLDKYYLAPTPAELAGHLGRALDWMRQHPDATPARAVIIYAWNENDEGGWLVPTLGEGTARLDALAKVLKDKPHGKGE